MYQGFARGLDQTLIRALHRLVCADLQPDATLLLDLDPAVGLARAWRQIRNGDREDLETRFEQEQLAFHQKVREGYLDLARREPQRFRIIDAGQGETQVTRAVERALDQILASR